jgi:hypothetical protein
VNPRSLFLPLQRSLLLAFLVSSHTVLVAPSARAEGNDSQANALREQAIFDDYLNLRFAEAEAKLKQALEMCESSCSNAVKARLYRDLGVVYIAGLKQPDQGLEMFVEAVVHDPDIELDPDLSSEELQAALEEARGRAKTAARPAPEEPSAKQPPPKDYQILPVPEYDGVFHTPPEEQLVNTPLPIYVEVKDDDWTAKVESVTLHYRGFGMVRFKEVQLEEMGNHGYGAEIDCKDVGSSPGKVDYYIVIHDEDGDAAAEVGSEKSPHSVEIKEEIEHSPQPLPGKKMPLQCDGTGAGSTPPGMVAEEPAPSDDCPPDFPGCAGSAEFGMEDEEIEPPDHVDFARHWLSLGLQLDFLWMNEVPDACTGNYTSEYTCFEGQTYWDPSVPGRTHDFDGNGVMEGGGTTTGGFASATQRVLLGYDFAITGNILLGARLGFAFGGGPQRTSQDPLNTETYPEFMALHGELRGSYWFGEQVLTTETFRPFVQLSGGAAQVDASLDTEVIDLSTGHSCNDATVSCRTPVQAWRKTGTMFFSGGVGSVLAFDKNIGVLIEARYMHLLPSAGSVLGLGGGLVVGF